MLFDAVWRGQRKRLMKTSPSEIQTPPQLFLLIWIQRHQNGLRRRFLIKPHTHTSHVSEENLSIAANSLAKKKKENKKYFFLPGGKQFFKALDSGVSTIDFTERVAFCQAWAHEHEELVWPFGRQRAKTVRGLKEATLRASAGLDVVKQAELHFDSAGGRPLTLPDRNHHPPFREKDKTLWDWHSS